MLEAVIFDMDGVIVDTEPGYIEAINRFLGEYGKSITKDINNKYIGTAMSFMWTEVKEYVGLDHLSVEECIHGMLEKRKEILEQEGYIPVKGVLSLIHELVEAKIPLAVASSSSRDEIETVLEALDIRDCFIDYVSGIDECENSKPAPDVFLKAAQKINVKPENCLVIEDSSLGALAGKRAGMDVIGYRNLEFGSQELKDADYIVTNMEDINLELCQKVKS